jgi:glycosyltransferase involved in cell wall biosynthesis
VLDAVDRLRAEGLPLELRLIEGLDRAEAMRRYAEADVIIDQLIIGWYGGLAVEAMSLGKPVIARLRREDLRFVPPEMAAQLPVISAGPDDLAEVLRRLCAMDPAELRAIGGAGRRFAERWHDPASIARTIAGDYRTAP